MTRRRSRRWPREQPEYKAEGELCDRFGAAMQRRGWLVYPEVAEWDLLLVSPGGVQVGVEAKLRCNLEVLSAIVGRARRRDVPHHLAALVPQASKHLETVCHSLGFHCWDHYTILDLEPPADARIVHARGGWPAEEILGVKEAKRWKHGGGIKLPEVPIQTGGGRAAPKVMSAWRLNALRLCALLEARGWVSSQDFRTHGVNPQRWRVALWIERTGTVPRTDGQPGVWAAYGKGAHYDSRGPAAGYREELELVRQKYGIAPAAAAAADGSAE